MTKFNAQSKVKGFTLIELIIVIAIIAILAALAIPQYQKAKLAAIVSAHNSDVNTIRSAALIADIDNNLTAGDISDETAKYLEGETMPLVSAEIKSLNVENFSVNKSEDGKIIVKPGLVEINQDGKIVLVD